MTTIVPIRYRGYLIRPGEAYTADTRYQFEHEDWDGAPTNAGEGPTDKRYGSGESIDDCMNQIDEQIEEAAK